jgi:hypothetical protein
MPRKIDHAKVLETYARLQNFTYTAREVGTSVPSVRQIVLISQGKCWRCGGTSAKGKTLCETCLVTDKRRMDDHRKSRVRAGLCVECDKPRCKLSGMYCEDHRIKAAERKERYKTKIANELRGAPWGSPLRLHQKLKSLKQHYGEAAVTVFNRYDGRCEICDTSYGDAAIHIHHINCDDTQHTEANLACLCFHCHKAIHQLIDAKNRQELIAWFKRTYPDKPLEVEQNVNL